MNLLVNNALAISLLPALTRTMSGRGIFGIASKVRKMLVGV